MTLAVGNDETHLGNLVAFLFRVAYINISEGHEPTCRNLSTTIYIIHIISYLLGERGCKCTTCAAYTHDIGTGCRIRDVCDNAQCIRTDVILSASANDAALKYPTSLRKE